MAMDFPTTGIEFRFPIPNGINPDVKIINTDAERPRRVQKNSTSARDEICKINIKVRDNAANAWFDYLEANLGASNLNWEMTGVQLFMRTNTSVVVQLMDYTDAVKPKDNPLYWQHQITLRYVSNQ